MLRQKVDLLNKHFVKRACDALLLHEKWQSSHAGTLVPLTFDPTTSCIFCERSEQCCWSPQ